MRRVAEVVAMAFRLKVGWNRVVKGGGFGSKRELSKLELKRDEGK